MNIVFVRLPLPLASRAPARTRASCPQSCAPFPRARQRGCDTANGAGGAPLTAVHDLDRSECPHSAAPGRAPVRRRHMDVPSANPGGRERTRSPWMGAGRVRGVAFLLVTSLWRRKEKLHARFGGGRKETWMSIGEVLSHAKDR